LTAVYVIDWERESGGFGGEITQRREERNGAKKRCVFTAFRNWFGHAGDDRINVCTRSFHGEKGRDVIGQGGVRRAAWG
jgi:hypothetical protein